MTVHSWKNGLMPSAQENRLDTLLLMRKVRDRIDREYAQPLDVGYQDMRWITVGPLNQPETSIVLHPPAVDPGITEDERSVILGLIAKGSYSALTLAVDDLDALFEKLVASGADVVQEPIDQDYGSFSRLRMHGAGDLGVTGSTDLAAGATITAAPAQQEWGGYIGHFNDPAGVAWKVAAAE